MDLFQGVDTLLEVDVLGGQLGLDVERGQHDGTADEELDRWHVETDLLIGLAELFLDILLRPRCKGAERSAALIRVSMRALG